MKYLLLVVLFFSLICSANSGGIKSEKKVSKKIILKAAGNVSLDCSIGLKAALTTAIFEILPMCGMQELAALVPAALGTVVAGGEIDEFHAYDKKIADNADKNSLVVSGLLGSFIGGVYDIFTIKHRSKPAASFYTAKGVIHAALTSESSKCGKSVNIIMNAFAGPNHSDLKNDSCL